MTNLESFKLWLKDHGVENLDNFKPLEDLVDTRKGCWGFECPASYKCEECKYKGFWWKEEK